MDLKALLAKLKAAGVKTETLSEDSLAVIAALVQEVVTPIQTTLAETQKALTAATTKNTELEGKVAELAKTATPAADPKATDKGKSKEDESAVTGVLAKISERLDKLETGFTAESTSKTVAKVVSDTINAKFGNHRMKAQLIEEATERGYTKPEDVVAFVERRNKQLVDAGIVKPEQLVAEPKTEGAKDAPKSAEDEKAQEDKRREAVKAVKPPSAF